MAAIMTPNAAPSMADTLPVIDFIRDDLREKMTQFAVRFDEFVNRSRMRIMEEHNQFHIDHAALDEQQRQCKQAINEVESKSSNHAQNLAKEAQETEEMQEAIESLTTQKQEHESRRDKIKDEIASIQSKIKYRRDAQAAHQRSLDAEAKHNLSELRFWETCLGMRMERSDESSDESDMVRFIFSGLDERNEHRECWFDLQIGARDYEVNTTKPRLNREAVRPVLKTLNETRQLAAFFKSMRELFIIAMLS